MTEAEAREWLGLPPDAPLSDLGRQCVDALAVAPAPIPGNDLSHLETFAAFLDELARRGIRPRPL